MAASWMVVAWRMMVAWRMVAPSNGPPQEGEVAASTTMAASTTAVMAAAASMAASSQHAMRPTVPLIRSRPHRGEGKLPPRALRPAQQAGGREPAFLDPIMPSVQHALLRPCIEEIACVARRSNLQGEVANALSPLEQLGSNGREASMVVGETIGRLRALKRTVSTIGDESEAHLRCTRQRALDVSEEMASSANGLFATPSNSKDSADPKPPGLLQDLLFDYMLRETGTGPRIGAGSKEGMDSIALQLAQESGRAQSLAVPPSLVELRSLLDSLERRDAQPTFEWCTSHKAKLKKLDLPLEVMLQLRAFAVVVESGDVLGAVSMARTHFPKLAQQMPNLVRQAMTSLALPRATRGGTEFFGAAQWADTCDLLRASYRALTATPPTSPLSLTLAAALAVFRTPSCGVGRACGSEDRVGKRASAAMASAASIGSKKTNKQLFEQLLEPPPPPSIGSPRCTELRADGVHATNGSHGHMTTMCPVCGPPYGWMASALPPVQRSHSCIVCPLTGERTHEDNLPTVLPDGSTYSYRALVERTVPGGAFLHPRTGEMVNLEHVSKAFFV